MRLSSFPVFVVAALALSACDPAGPADSTGGASAGTGSASAAAIAAANCDAELYQYLVGGPISAASEISYAGTIRILGPDDFVTRDYFPSRLTVTTRPDDTVGRVFCG